MTALKGTLATDTGVSVTVGLIQVPEGTGSTVLWSPLTDGDAPWIWWDVFHLVYTEQVADAVVSSAAFAARRTIDSKAMRKLRNTELQVVMENTTIGGLTATSVHTIGSMRVLAGS